MYREPLEHISQLAHVAGPRRRHQLFERIRAERGALDLIGRAEDIQKIVDERRHVVRPFPQRRNLDVDDVQTIEEIFAKFVCGDPVDQPPVGCGDDAHVDDRCAPFGADALNFAVLQKPQQRGLHLKAHLPDFVHEDRAAVRLLEPALFVAVRVGETAAHVSEKLRGQQRIGNARAVDRDQFCAAASLR